MNNLIKTFMERVACDCEDGDSREHSHAHTTSDPAKIQSAAEELVEKARTEAIKEFKEKITKIRNTHEHRAGCGTACRAIDEILKIE